MENNKEHEEGEKKKVMNRAAVKQKQNTKILTHQTVQWLLSFTRTSSKWYSGV